MARPNSRATFSQFCLRALGAPMLTVNVTEEQIDDRIDEALQEFKLYNFDGSEKQYYKHVLTDEDMTNQYIEIPENIFGAVNILPLSTSWNTSDMFNIQYQIALNELHTLTSIQLAPYYMMRQHLNLIQEIFNGVKPIRYNRHKNRLYIDMNWAEVVEDQTLIVEAYEVVDPDTYTDVWNDPFLQRHAIALIKRQWGSNLKKFPMVLPGGITFSGQQIYDEAEAELAKMREDRMLFSTPVDFFVG